MDGYPPHMAGSTRVSRGWIARSAALVFVAVSVGLGGLVHQVMEELRETRAEVERLRDLADHQREELTSVKQDLGTVDRKLTDAQALEAAARAHLMREIEARTGSESKQVREQLDELEERLAALRTAAEENARLLAAAQSNETVEVRYHELMSPTVRINARHEVGSGTILWSKSTGRRARTFVLTAWHIVAENASSRTDDPLEVDFYEGGELIRTELGRVVTRQETIDLALVEVRGYHVYSRQARLPSRAQLAAMEVFAKVYAIGCPLGYSPLPTSGELMSKQKELDGNVYWMINAPTIFGNSGGGIYHADSRTLIGVLSRISAYKNMIDVAVPHMGLVLPMDQVYDWLDTTRYAFAYTDRLHEPQAAQPAGLDTDKQTKPLPASAGDGGKR